MTNVTAHFTVYEFRCHDGTPYPDEWVADRLTVLCATLEMIRAEVGGRAVHIISGYRTPVHNEALRSSDGSGTGVAKNSQHLVGRAADIAVEGMRPRDVHAAVMRLFKAGKLSSLGGIGLYAGWVHVDIRAKVGDHLAQWDTTDTSV